MLDHSALTVRRKISGAIDTIARRVAAGCRRIGRWLYNEEDARARGHGWEIHETACGLGRRYRDQRFDTRRPR